MPRFFFNIRDAQRVTHDTEGSELADLQAARLEAEQSARELIADAIRRGSPIPDGVFEIVDENGIVQARYHLRDAISTGEE